MTLPQRPPIITLLNYLLTITSSSITTTTAFLSSPPTITFHKPNYSRLITTRHHTPLHPLYSSSEIIYDPNDDDDDDEETNSPSAYQLSQPSEFTNSTTPLDWGSALTSLRQRVSDVKSGKSSSPSQTLFRLMTSETPNVAISRFVTNANPEIVAAMSGSVGGLLGGLSSPTSGAEIIVKSNVEKLSSLCFQLMMTGYMFRNAEYVLALRGLMKLSKGAGIEEYKRAFERLDKDGSGFIEAREVEELLSRVYGGKAPKFEVQAFLRFFDRNEDGRISWTEFEAGLGVVKAEYKGGWSFLGGDVDDGDEEEDEDDDMMEPTLSGTIEVELTDGKTIEIEAQDYVNDLKREAQELKDALRREKGESDGDDDESNSSTTSSLQKAIINSSSSSSPSQSIVSYIASLGGDLSTLTKGISPEVVDAMKLLVDFVLDGGKGKNADEKDEMEIPGGALQQLALWQLVLGYKLREEEATGGYKKMMDD